MSSESEDQGAQGNPEQPEASAGRKVIETIVWKLIPIAIAVALAVLYWPR